MSAIKEYLEDPKLLLLETNRLSIVLELTRKHFSHDSPNAYSTLPFLIFAFGLPSSRTSGEHS